MFNNWDNRFTGTEDQMVKQFIREFKPKSLRFSDTFVRAQYYEQVRIPQISRVSDLIVRAGDSRLINIEFKLDDWDCLMRQARDHMKWCDYGYVCVPLTYLSWKPHRHVNFLLSKGIGLIGATNDTFVEVFKAKHNTYKKGKSKEIRNSVLKTLKEL